MAQDPVDAQEKQENVVPARKKLSNGIILGPDGKP